MNKETGQVFEFQVDLTNCKRELIHITNPAQTVIS